MIELVLAKKLLTRFKNEKGEAITAVILFALFIVYIFIPIFAAVIEKQLFYLRAVEMRESMEIACLATYDSMRASDATKAVIDYDATKVNSTFKYYLSKNLNINSDLTPKSSGCIPQGIVTVNSINIYINGFPVAFPEGKYLTRPTVHAVITVPIKPTLYQYTVLSLLGVSTINCKLHTDVEIPVNR